MIKIVINDCYGNLSISWDTFFYLAERNHPIAEDLFVKWSENCGLLNWEVVDGPCTASVNLERDDPVLVSAVEELGGKRAGGDHAELKIIEIPEGVDWEIEEYDGLEYVTEVHRTWR